MPTLHWLHRDRSIQAASQAPYRLLEEVPALSYGDPTTQNMLIQGDNLHALKALLPYYAGQVKCVFIDPPYNTRKDFEQYEDNLEHTIWLEMMYPRLELLRELLAEDGSLWVTLDDNEAHYFKVLADEVFGRKHFIASVIWRKNFSPKSTARHFSVDHDNLFVFAKNADFWTPNLMSRSEKQDKAYKNPDEDPRGVWMSDNLTARNYYSLGVYPIETPSGRVIEGPPPGTYWRVSKEKFLELDRDNRIWWGKDGNGTPRLKRFLSEVKQGVVPQTWWSYEEVGHTQDAKKEMVSLFQQDIFATPKPEKLLERVFHIATNPNDLVLDSFLGSGTTAAVAHKMGRRYIGVELGDHAITHCQPRLKKVVDGEQGGISQAVGWQGGGGFRFYKLGEPIFDEAGQLNPAISFQALAAHIWFTETHTPLASRPESTLLGSHNGVAYYLLYNGILGDKRPQGGNVLTSRVLDALPPHDGPRVIYGESCRIGPTRLAACGITFKQTPYDVQAR